MRRAPTVIVGCVLVAAWFGWIVYLVATMAPELESPTPTTTTDRP